MQIVELKVKVEKSQLAALQSQVKALDGKTINIKVNAQGIENLNKNFTSLVNAMAKMETAQAKRAAANARMAESENKVKIAQEQTAQTLNKRAAAEAKVRQEVQKRANEQVKLRVQEEKTRTETQKTLQEQAKTTKQMSKTLQEQEKVRREVQKTTQSYNKAAQEQLKLQTQMEKTRTAYARASKSAGSYGESIGKASKEVSGFQRLMGGSFGEIAGKMLMWQAMGEVVSVPIRAMKEALGTMKAVDDELVQIRKVTDFNKQQLKEVEEQAYKTASAYGESADAYLANVAAFARAGYQDRSAGLAELSTKAQIVADTTADVANQFLLSTDAAYHYGGSIEELTRVLDGVNEIENNNATSIEKIAEGMGLVAPVASQAKVGVDELAAALGTVTAVTQRSGSEAARALRALFLNIIGDTKTEIEDGATWTAGEIEGLRDVLRQFAPEVVKFADETKTVINPMEAMAALSKAMKDGVLTEQQLMEMVSDIGGKLRTSQLLAIIQNWDMYEKMLDEYRNAAGSADREVENAMDSWTRKTNVLKNTWTEFVSHMVETDTIKGALDGVTSAIEFLDSDIGQLTIKASGYAIAISGIAKLLTGLGSAIKGNEILSLFIGAGSLKDIGAAFSLAGEGIAKFFSGPLGLATVGVGTIAGFLALMDAATVSFNEQSKAVEELEGQYESLYGAGSEYAQLMEGHNAGTLNQQEERRYQLLKLEADEMERQLKVARELEQTLFNQQYGDKSNRKLTRRDREGNPVYETNEDEITKDVKATRDLKKAQDDLSKSYTDGKSNLDDYRKGVQDLLSENKFLYETLSDFKEWGLDLTPAQEEFLNFYNWMLDTLSGTDTDLKIDIALNGLEEAKVGVGEFAGKTVMDAEKVRKALADVGLSAEEIQEEIANLEATGVVSIDVESEGTDELLSDLEEIGIAVRDLETGEIKINVDALGELGDMLGLSQDQVTKFIQKLQEADNVTFTNAKGEIAGVEGALTNLSQKSPMELLMTVKDETKGVFAELKERIKNYDGTTATADLEANDNASKTVDGAQDKVDKLDQSKAVPTLKATDGISSVANKARNAVLAVPKSHTTKFSGDTSALSSAVSRAKALIQSAFAAGGGTPSGSTSSGGKSVSGRPSQFATGTTRTQGGAALLGDELSSDGSPRPELVIRRSGDAFLAGVNGPVVTTLPAGARVYNFRETMDIFSGRDVVDLPAYASGLRTGGLKSGTLSKLRREGKAIRSGTSTVPTAKAQTARTTKTETAKKSTSSTSSSSTKSSTSSTSSSSTKSSSASKSSGSSAATKTASGSSATAKSSGTSSKSSSGGSKSSDTDEYLESLKKQLDVLQSQYGFLEASGAETEALIAKSREIQNQLGVINNYLRATGGEEKDIWDNSAAWYKELEKIREVQRQVYQKERALLETEVNLYDKQGREVSDTVEKLRAIQATLSKEADFLRSIKAEQTEINELSIEWWEVQEKIHAVQRAIYQDERALLETEAELYQLQGRLVTERIDKLKKAQDAIHREAEYLRSIKASQQEINELSIEWWRIQEQILGIQKDLVSELDSAISKELKKAQEERDAEISLIDKEIERLREAKEIQEDQLELEEKRKKVEEARFALENAQNERNVRYFNKEKNQWEWGADPTEVKNARKSLEEAEKDLADYLAEKEFEAQIEALEAQKDDINRRYDSLESRWNRLSESFEEPIRDIRDILRDLLATGTMTGAQVDAVKDLVGDIKVFTGEIFASVSGTRTEAVAKAKDGSTYNIASQKGIDFVNSAPVGSTMTGGDGSVWAKNTDLSTTITKNGKDYTVSGGVRYDVGSEKGLDFIQSAPPGAIMAGGDGSQWKKNPDGTTTISKNGTTYTVSNNAFRDIASRTAYTPNGERYLIGSQKGLDFINNADFGSTMKGGDGSFWQKLANGSTTITKDGKTFTVYDGGGILSGIGGIKKSGGDEMILPPDITSYMLRPNADQRFRSRLDELGYLYGPKGVQGLKNGSQDHYGDVYTFGNVTLTEEKAKTTTVYELAQISRSLGVY